MTLFISKFLLSVLRNSFFFTSLSNVYLNLPDDNDNAADSDNGNDVDEDDDDSEVECKIYGNQSPRFIMSVQ